MAFADKLLRKGYSSEFLAARFDMFKEHHSKMVKFSAQVKKFLKANFVDSSI